MRKYIYLLLLIFCALPIWANNATNVRVRQEGKSIIITYDLNKKSNVRILMASGNNQQYKELKSITGNVGKSVPAGKSRKVVWKPLEEYAEFVAQNVRFKVETQSTYEDYALNGKVKTLLMGQVGYSLAPQLSYGGMIGQMYHGIGWYINGRSNFNFVPSAELSCDKGGFIKGSGLPFYSGRTSTIHYMINGGFMLDFLELDWSPNNRFHTFGFYIGGGYGKRELQWETTDGVWVKYEPTSHSGFSGNIGLFGSFYGVTLNVGVNTINFKYLDLEAGIGLMF